MTSIGRRALAAAIVLIGVGLAVPAVSGTSQTTQTTPPTTQTPPVPKPFPGSNPPPATPAKPAQPPAQTPDKTSPSPPPPQVPPAPSETTPPPVGAPTEAQLGVRVFPGAEFLESFDAGRGQRLYLYGTNSTYLEVVTFYKNLLRSGTELFKEPAMQQFELPGVKYQRETMAYPPSVVVKDYTWVGLTGDLKEGYVFVDGTTEKRFKTIVQIVPGPMK